MAEIKITPKAKLKKFNSLVGCYHNEENMLASSHHLCFDNTVVPLL